MNISTAFLILITSANLGATVYMAKTALEAKRHLEQEIEEVRIKASRAVFKMQNALEELDL